MKLLSFFVIYIIFGIWNNVGAQGFFIPASELEPRYEKLPPVPYSSRPTFNQNQKQRIQKYIAVDGRFIPIIEERPLVMEDEQTDTLAPVVPEEIQVTESGAPQTDNKIAATVPESARSASVPQIQPETIFAVSAPQTDPVDVGLPSYRNRYAQYLSDLTLFQHGGFLPSNADLENTLAKMNSNEYRIMYQGEP